MKLLLPASILTRLRRELRAAGRREIGGLLMGEHVQDDVFRIVDLTVQHTGGTAACFIRHPNEHQAELDHFFERTGADYRRFNYLGEWHSHPSFQPLPSSTDVDTMQSIVGDPTVGVHFLSLLIVKLSGRRIVQMSATVFCPEYHPVAVEVEVEDVNADSRPSKWSLFRSIARLFTR
jgi:[CysO sulfur-carrier protein]-S-L-cysteine hydrolase